MAKRKKIDSGKLVKMITDGVEQSEILEEFGFKNSTQLKVAYTNALMNTGQIAAIKSSRGGTTARQVSKEVVVGKRGSLIIPKALVGELGFLEGDSFLVKKTKVGISLSRS